MHCHYCERETYELNSCVFCNRVNACEDCLPLEDIETEEIVFRGVCCRDCQPLLGKRAASRGTAGLDPQPDALPSLPEECRKTLQNLRK